MILNVPRTKLNAGPASRPKFEKENTFAATADLRSIYNYFNKVFTRKIKSRKTLPGGVARTTYVLLATTTLPPIPEIARDIFILN